MWSRLVSEPGDRAMGGNCRGIETTTICLSVSITQKNPPNVRPTWLNKR